VSSADDRDLERYLRHDDALSRAYAELKSERPSPALDQAVLARARDALKSAPRGGKRPRNWTAITALAATVLLSFGLVMRLALEPESQTPAALPQDSAQPLPRASSPAAETDQGSFEKKDTTRFAPSPNVPAASSIESQRPVIEEEIRAATEQVPATSEPTPPAAVLERSAPPAPAAAPKLGDVRRETAPATQPLRPDRASANGAEERASAGLLKSQAEVAAPRNRDATAAASSVTTADEAAAKEELMLKPEAWLAEIERLRAAGETEAAERELARFRKAYPDYFEILKPQPQRQ
jgi:hypothetical protein